MNTPLLLICLFVLQSILSASENGTDFRVAHGTDVGSMKKENYGHLVRLIIVYSTTEYGNELKAPNGKDARLHLGSCTGMLATRAQVRGEKKLPKSGKAEYVLTAGHCTPLKKRPALHDVKGTARVKAENTWHHTEHLYVVSGFENVRMPKIVWQSSRNSYKLVFNSAYESFVSAVNWIAYRWYPNDSGFTEDGSHIDDIAILKLQTEFETPVIPLQYDDKITPGTKDMRDECRFAGWGVDEFGTADGFLKQVEQPNGMQLLTEAECITVSKEQLNKYPSCARPTASILEAKQKVELCTRHPKGSTPCFGDSGGPLMCKHRDNDGKLGEEKVVGIHGWGLGGTVAQKVKGWCWDSIEKSVVFCDKQKERKLDSLSFYSRLSNKETRRFLKFCRVLIEQPEKFKDKPDSIKRCSAKEYKPMDVEFK